MFSEFHLPDELLRALAKLGFTQPTAVQQQVIPLGVERKDLMVQAMTGSGKTAAFLLPMMQRFLDCPSPHTGARALILAPTRELARQILDRFLQLGSYTRLTAGLITGGDPMSHQVATLRRNPEILIATPGRLRDHLERGSTDLGDIEVLVLDEADRMLDMGFAPDVLEIVGRCKGNRQSMLFSATLDHRGLKPIVERLLHNPEVVVASPKREPHPDIRHQTLLADDPAHKQALLVWLLTHEAFDQALVFTNTRERAGDLGAFLYAQGQRVGVLHGELDQRERNRIIGLLRSGQIRVLVATDLAARGLDVPAIDLVIDFDLARSGDDYLHRTGRTGRAGKPGLAIALVGATDWNRMEGIERYLRLTFERRTIPGLAARFQGPKRRQGAGKAPETRNDKVTEGRSPAVKVKDRLRDRRNKGKRRIPSSGAAVEAGLTPLKRK